MTDNVSMPFDEPDKVTIFGDWHGYGAWANRALREASRRGVRVGVHVGDFGIWPGRTGQVFLDEVERSLILNQMDLVFVPGNHEDYNQIDSWEPHPETGLVHVRQRLYYLPRGARWTWNGKRWLALGGATSVDREWRTPHVDWWPQEAITMADAMRAIDGGPADVMVCHDTPSGYRVPGIPPDGTFPADAIRTAETHRELLRAVVDEVRPTWLYHGHYHSRYSYELPGWSGEDTCFIEGLDMNGTYARNWLDVEL